MSRFGILLLALLTPTTALAEISVERGEYLVQTVMGCGNCHTPFSPEGLDFAADLSGRLVEKTEAFTAIAPNITPASRIANWTDAELALSIREGIRPDGSIIGAPMPFKAYRSISDADLASIVMYLRTVPAVENDAGESVYNVPLPPAYGPPITEPVETPPPDDQVAYGAYLSALGHCMECHSPLTPAGPDWETGFARGGAEFHGPWGISIAPNLTNHPDGLADYTDAEIIQMITQGTRPNGAPMFPPMGYGYFARMTDSDIAALVAYLRSLPGQSNL